jgi:hypothetical protein
LQLATSNPQMHNMYQAYRNMYEALGVKDIDTLLVKPQPPQPMDPALENIMAMSGKPFQAFPGQDHRAHITSHLNFMATNMAKNNPMVTAALEKNIMEHISLMSQEQIELEFPQELQQLAMMAQDPNMAQAAQQISQKIESRKAVLIAEMLEEFLKEEREVTSGLGNDPIAKLRERELDLKAMDDARKKREGEERLNLDRMKAMMNQSDKQDKLEQNEKLANLRADTSIEKTILSKSIPNVDKMIPSIEIEKYKGENR